MPSTDARIVDPENPDIVLPIGTIGELAIQGPQVFQGYWNRPEETIKTLHNGWLITGDIPRMDEDGFFYIVERKKDMIIVGGYKVFPRDIEEELYKNPKMQEATVIGVKHPKMGEVPKAFVVLKHGARPRPEERVCGLYEAAHRRVTSYRAPLNFATHCPRRLSAKCCGGSWWKRKRRKAMDNEQ